MFKTIAAFLGAAGAVATVTAALWAWQAALRLSAAAARPEIAVWSVRSGAVALGAIAQVVLLTCVVTRVYRRDVFSRILQALAALVGGAGIVSAVALGLAGR